jgi:hypothetical protein
MSALIPWNLTTGIVLNNGKIVLKWGEYFDDLKKIAEPKVIVRSDSIHFEWLSCIALWGVEADVSVCRFIGVPNPRAYHLYLPNFHHIKLALVGYFTTPAEAQAQMRRIHALITEATGYAATSYPDYQEHLPSIMWRLPGLEIHLSPSCRYKREEREHYLESVRLDITVTHEPAGFAELKDSAMQIHLREGKGREIGEVAWHLPYD